MMTNSEAIKKDKKYLFEKMMDLTKDEFDERDEAYNVGVSECIDILTKFSFNNIDSVFSDYKKEKDVQHNMVIEWSNLYNMELNENTKLKAEIERLKIEPDKEVLDDAFDLGYQTCLRHNGVCWKDAEEIQKLRKEIEQFADELIIVRIENELLKKKNELTNYYFEQYAAAIDEIEQLKEEVLANENWSDVVERTLKKEIDKNEMLQSKLEQSVKFKEYFMELYNQGLEVSNWHLNGDLEPLTNFIDSALEEAEQHLKGKV